MNVTKVATWIKSLGTEKARELVSDYLLNKSPFRTQYTSQTDFEKSVNYWLYCGNELLKENG